MQSIYASMIEITVFWEFWVRLAAWIYKYDVHFFAGDFNMALCQVVTRLREQNITVDCCAWYPWRHATTEVHEQSLGFDSCGIFYIGGQVQVKLNWGIDRIPELTAVAEHMRQSELHVYDGVRTPGQHWASYRSSWKHKKDLNQMV